MTRVVFVDNNDSSVQIEICHNCSYCHSWIEKLTFWDHTKIYGSIIYSAEDSTIRKADLPRTQNNGVGPPSLLSPV